MTGKWVAAGLRSVLLVAFIIVAGCGSGTGATSAAHPTASPTPTPPPLALVTRSINPTGPTILYGLNADTGAVRWHTQFDGYSTFEPVTLGTQAMLPVIKSFSAGAITVDFAAFNLGTGIETSLGTTSVGAVCGVQLISHSAVVFCGKDSAGHTTLTAFATSFASPLWTAKMPTNTDTSGFGVVGDKVYIRLVNLSTHARSLVAYDGSNGSLAWQKSMPGVKAVGGLVAYGTDAFYQFDTLSDPFINAWRVSAFSLADGSPLWSVKAVGGQLGSVIGSANGALFYTIPQANSTTVIALNTKDGTQLWKQASIATAIHGYLAADTHQVSLALIGSADRSAVMYGVSADSWAKKWEHTYPTQGLNSFSQVGDSLIYVLTDASGATAYAMNAADGSTKWQQALG